MGMDLRLSENVKAEVRAINVYDETFFDQLLKYTLTELDKKFDPYTRESKEVESHAFEYQINDFCKIVVDMNLCVSTYYNSFKKLTYTDLFVKNLYTFLEDSSNCDEIKLKIWRFDTKANDFIEISIEDEIVKEIEGELVN